MVGNRVFPDYEAADQFARQSANQPVEESEQPAEEAEQPTEEPQGEAESSDPEGHGQRQLDWEEPNQRGEVSANLPDGREARIVPKLGGGHKVRISRAETARVDADEGKGPEFQSRETAKDWAERAAVDGVEVANRDAQDGEIQPPSAAPETDPMARPGPDKEAEWLKGFSGQQRDLMRATHSYRGAEDRWEKLRQEGATDKQIREQLGKEIPDGGVPYISARGGKSPMIQRGDPSLGDAAPAGSFNLTGNALVKETREVLNIPQPGQGAGTQQSEQTEPPSTTATPETQEKELSEEQKSRLVSGFEEINEFVDQNGREPSEDGPFKEQRMARRLRSIRQFDSRQQALADYDRHNLLSPGEGASDEAFREATKRGTGQLPPDEITKDDGSPFTSEASAKRARTGKAKNNNWDLSNYEVTPVEGGYVLRNPNQDEARAREEIFQADPEKREGRTEEPGQEVDLASEADEFRADDIDQQALEDRQEAIKKADAPRPAGRNLDPKREQQKAEEADREDYLSRKALAGSPEARRAYGGRIVGRRRYDDQSNRASGGRSREQINADMAEMREISTQRERLEQEAMEAPDPEGMPEPTTALDPRPEQPAGAPEQGDEGDLNRTMNLGSHGKKTGTLPDRDSALAYDLGEKVAQGESDPVLYEGNIPTSSIEITVRDEELGHRIPINDDDLAFYRNLVRSAVKKDAKIPDFQSVQRIIHDDRTNPKLKFRYPDPDRIVERYFPKQAEEQQAQGTEEQPSQEEAGQGEAGRTFGYSDNHPEWATKFEDQVGGSTVYSDNEVALIEGWSIVNGAPVYAGVHRDKGKTRVDIESFTGSIFSQDQYDRLVEAKQEQQAWQKRMFAANPDGPFDPNKTVTTSDNIEPEIGEVARDWFNMLGLKGKLFLTAKQDAQDADRYNLYGPYALIRSTQVRPEEGGASIPSIPAIKPGDETVDDYRRVIILGQTTRRSEQLEKLAHELGHMLEETELQDADQETKDAILEEYSKFLETAGQTNAKEWVKKLRAHTSGKLTKTANAAHTTADKLPTYWRSFGEWFADQVAKWATSSDAPVSVVERFFKRIADGLRRLYSSVAGRDYLPNDVVKAYLDGRATRNPVATFPPPQSGEAQAAQEEGGEAGETQQPMDGWRDSLPKARDYANKLGIPHQGKSLDQIVADIDAQQTDGGQEAEGGQDESYGANNTIFTKDEYEQAKAELRRKLNQTNAGLDPEMVQLGIQVAGFHIEAGVRDFGTWARRMMDDLGENARPYLRGWYENARHYPGLDTEGMTPAAEIDAQGEDALIDAGQEPPEGYEPYQVTVSEGQKWAVPQTQGERNYGDTLFDTWEEAVEEAQFVKRKNDERAATEADLEARRQQEEAEEERRLAMNGFGDTLSPAARARAAKTLDKQIRYEGREVSRRQLIEELVADGRTVTNEGGKRRLMAEDGRFLDTDALTNTGMDYAEFLVGQKGGEAPQESQAENQEDEGGQGAPEQDLGEGDMAARSQQLASALSDRIMRQSQQDSPQKVTWEELFQMADRYFGGTQAEGTYTSRDAYDAMELGLNLAIIGEQERFHPNSREPATERNILSRIENKLLSMLPTQSKRTEEQQDLQQFSTPPTHAHAAAWVANLGQNDVVLEPSAGTGSMMAHAINGIENAGGNGNRQVVANEYSERRAEMIEPMVNRVYQEDAQHLDGILPDDLRPSVVLMNPPFSADAKQGGKKDLGLAGRHVESALKKMADGGRLVAIVGRGMEFGRARTQAWWDKIRSQYNVRANVGISGENYRKFGTSFDNRIIIIDKNGATEAEPLSEDVTTVGELPQLLEGIRDERPASEPTRPEQGGQTGAQETGAGEGRPRATGQPGTGQVGPGERGARDTEGERTGPPGVGGGATVPGGPGSGDGSAAQPDQGGTGGSVAPERETDTQGGGEAGGTAGVPGAGQERGEGPLSSNERPTGALEEAPESNELEGQEITGATFERYKPQKVFQEAPSHPAPLAESAAMASVKAPTLTYEPSLPKEVLDQGLLSDIQIEAIAAAGQAHQEMLPDGETRKGFFIGDGTGVGKGRELIGIVLDNWQQGRRKHVWVSENQKLFEDAQRDAEETGLGKDKLIRHGSISSTGSIGAGEGVVFTTYDTLTQKSSPETDAAGNKVTEGQYRLDQLVEWLGEDFDGVIAFDESHNMGNVADEETDFGTKKGSKKAQFGVSLQQRLPNARVVYASATGATKVGNLAYAERLGLWGEGTAFSSRNQFIEEIENGGVGAMEVVARDMKTMGMFTSRNISYDGVEYDMVEHQLTPDQRETYRKLTDAWQRVLNNMESVLEEIASYQTQSGDTKVSGKARGKALSTFWGAHQRFFQQVITGMQVPTTVQSIREDLEAGNSAVVQLVSTGEATQERRLAQAMEADLPLEELDLSPRDILMQYLEMSFPTQKYETVVDSNGNQNLEPATDSNGNAVHDPDALAKKQQLMEELGDLEVPQNALYQIMRAFGPDNVAEITGRSQRVVEREDGLQLEKITAKQTKKEADDFMAGKKRILVFSMAGGTGRSYHADLNAENQQKRKHYLLEPGWRADKAVQGFGRTHRANQAQPPEYDLVTTDLKAQRRFLSSIARRLDSLGALTKGQRETTSQGMFSADMNLESDEGRKAVDQLFREVARDQVEGLSMETLEKEMVPEIRDDNGNFNEGKIPDIPRFLNRLLSLEPDTMDQVFDAFYERLEANIEWAREQGKLDTGMETLKANSIEKAEEVEIPLHGGRHQASYIKLQLKTPVTPVTFERLPKDDSLTFARQKRSGRLYAFTRGTNVTDPNTGQIKRMWNRQGPVLKDRISDQEYREKYETFEGAEAELQAAWEEEAQNAPAERTSSVHMISGALLPIWDRLPSGNAQVYQAYTDQGERILGREIRGKDVDSVLNALGVGRDAPQITPAEAVNRIMDDGATVELANGWQVRRSRVSGEDRIEVANVEAADRGILKQRGAFTEVVNYKTRTFLPLNQATEILGKITENTPITQVHERGAGTQSRGQRGGDVQFDIEEGTAAGLSEQTFRDAVDRVTRNWEWARNRVEALNSPDEAPQPVADSVRETLRDGLLIPGVAYNGRIYLFRDQLTSQEEVEGLIFHEATHVALREKSGKSGLDLTAMLGGLANRIGGAGQINRIAQKNGIDLSPWATRGEPGQDEGDKTIQRARMVDELLAELNYNVPYESLSGRVQRAIKEFLGKLRDWLRQRGLTNLAERLGMDLERLNDADLTYLAGNLRKWAQMENGVRAYSPAGEGGVKMAQAARAAGDRTANFRRWFGDSQATTPDGEPQVMYHGTTSNFARPNGNIFLTSDPDVASEYAESGSFTDALSGADEDSLGTANVMPVYVRAETPLTVHSNEDLADALDRENTPGVEGAPVHQNLNAVLEDADAMATLRRKGYDSIYLTSDISPGTTLPHDSWVVFDPQQIKSATGNIGSFTEMADIRFSIRPNASEAEQNKTNWGDNLGNITAKAPTKDEVTEFVQDNWTQFRKGFMDLLTLDQVESVYSKLFKGSKHSNPLWKFRNLSDQFQQSRNEDIAEASATHERWNKLLRKNREASDTMADIMNRATVAEIHPDQDLADQDHYQDMVRRAERLREQIEQVEQESPPEWQAPSLEVGLADMRQQLEELDEAIAEAPRLRELWKSLPDEAKELYQEVKDAYAKQHDKVREALVQRIEETLASGNEKQAMIADINQKFMQAKENGPYFPLHRFGDFWIKVDRPGQKPIFEMVETARQQRKRMKELRQEGFSDDQMTHGKLAEQFPELEGVSSDFMASLMDAINETTTGSRERAELRDSVYQLYLKHLPEMSTKKQYIHRKKTPGFSGDASRGFAKQMFHGAYQLARLRFTHKLQQQIDDMQDQVTNRLVSDPNTAQQAVDRVKKQFEFIMNPGGNPWVQKGTSIGFTWYLGATPAAALVNISQTPLMALPNIAAHYGFKNTSAELVGRANRDYTKIIRSAGRRDIADITLPDDMKNEVKYGEDLETALNRFGEEGGFDLTLSQDLAGQGQTPSEVYNDRWRRAMGAVSFMFHEAERYNRIVTFTSAYRLAREGGNGIDPVGHEEAYLFAHDMTYNSHFNYSNVNRATILQKNWTRLPFMFMQFSQNMMFQVGRNLQQSLAGETKEVRRLAQRRFAGIMGMHALLAGGFGLPGATLFMHIMDTLTSLFDDEDDPFDAKVAFQNHLAEYLGPTTATAITKGLPRALTPIDTHARLSLDGLLFRQPANDIQGEEWARYSLEQLAGPLYSAGKDFLGGVNTIASEGRIMRGVEDMVPKAISDGLAAMRYSQEGVRNFRKDVIVDDVTPAEIVTQALGFTPSRVSQYYDAYFAAENAEKRINRRRDTLLNKYWLGLRNGDSDTMGEAMEGITAFNKSYPEVAISASTLSQSMESRMRYTAESKMGIHIDKKLRPKIMENLKAYGLED
ncbi:PLxRFG domain-containing protein [Thiohalorhabdus sp.]|uniref:PLxRFG domain-containing protein n=1 Tax=Thiohalorhabdus sp. TaxID=3094134 RepID=UPI002FC39F9E